MQVRTYIGCICMVLYSIFYLDAKKLGAFFGHKRENEMPGGNAARCVSRRVSSWRFRTRHYLRASSRSSSSTEYSTVTFSTSTVSKNSRRAVPTRLSMKSSSCSSSPTGSSENISVHWARKSILRIALSLPDCSKRLLIATEDFKLRRQNRLN